MNTVTFFCAIAISIAFVEGGSYRHPRQNGWGWGSSPPPPPPPALGTNVSMVGASEAIGIAGAVAEHASSISVAGSPDVPALLSLGAGSNVGLAQSSSNYQQSQINTDGSSSVNQGNYASNDGYANEFLYGNAQGLDVNANSAGWSAVQGEGAVNQADVLEHQGQGGAATGR